MECVVWGAKGGIRKNNDCQLWASELSGMETQEDFYPLSRRYLGAAWHKAKRTLG